MTAKLSYELLSAAFITQRRLKIYKHSLDNEGCDLIIEDDTDLARKFQLKSYSGNEKKWKIHCNILRPGMANGPDYGIENVICPNTPGAVVLQRVFAQTQTSVGIQYFYTDINIISYIAISNDPAYRQKRPTAQNILLQLNNNIRHIMVSRAVFVPLKDASSILKIAGFHNNYEFPFDCHRLNKLYRGRESTTNAPAEIRFHLTSIKKHLARL